MSEVPLYRVVWQPHLAVFRLVASRFFFFFITLEPRVE